MVQPLCRGIANERLVIDAERGGSAGCQRNRSEAGGLQAYFLGPQCASRDRDRRLERTQRRPVSFNARRGRELSLTRLSAYTRRALTGVLGRSRHRSRPIQANGRDEEYYGALPFMTVAMHPCNLMAWHNRGAEPPFRNSLNDVPQWCTIWVSVASS